MTLVESGNGAETVRLPDSILQGAGNLAVSPAQLQTSPEALVSEIEVEVSQRMAVITDRYMTGVAREGIRTPSGDTRTRASIRSEAPNGLYNPRRAGWSFYRYSTQDPWRDENPGLCGVVTEFIEDVTKVTEDIEQRVGDTPAPTLTYQNHKRAAAAKGNGATVVTRAIHDADEGLGFWGRGLPNAEFLRVVANPGANTVIVDPEKRQVQGSPLYFEVPPTPAVKALVVGSGDGWGVRERGACETAILPRFVREAMIREGELRITSLGTGTGEPTMDIGLALFDELGIFGRVIANGFDINSNSLAVAEYLAAGKRSRLLDPRRLQFNGTNLNLLTREGIWQAVGGTKPHVVEFFGFGEYVPRENPTDPIEIKQRELAKRAGWLSAEEFHAAVYEALPRGSVIVTGNMRGDSPQAKFPIKGLGWSGIIQRSSEEYASILEAALPPEAQVHFLQPDHDPKRSAGVYNVVAIVKP